jgi:hypothetical protein
MGDYYSGRRRERLFALQMVATSLSAAVFIAAGGFLGQNDWRTRFCVVCSGFDLPATDGLEAWNPEARTVAAQPAPPGAPGAFPWRALTPMYALALLAGLRSVHRAGAGRLSAQPVARGCAVQSA